MLHTSLGLLPLAQESQGKADEEDNDGEEHERSIGLVHPAARQNPVGVGVLAVIAVPNLFAVLASVDQVAIEDAHSIRITAPFLARYTSHLDGDQLNFNVSDGFQCISQHTHKATSQINERDESINKHHDGSLQGLDPGCCHPSEGCQ